MGVQQDGGEDGTRAADLEKSSPKLTKLTKRQKIVFAVLAMLYFNSAIIMSIQAPLYPPEAEKKNVTATEFGLVLGTYDIARVIFLPLAGSYVNRIGLGLAFNAGVLLEAISVFLFGFLEVIQNRELFVGASFLLRVTEALGASGSSISVLSLLADEFPNSVGTVSGLFESIFGVGMSIGPVLGTVFFVIGGFIFPFALIGTFHFIFCIMVNLFVLRNCFGKDEPAKDMTSKSELESDDEIKEKYTLINLLKIPSVAFFPICLIVSATNWGFNVALLEPHLSQFDLSEILVGCAFLLYCGSYTVSCVIIGFIIKKYLSEHAIWFTLFGGAINGIAMSIIGPLPLLPFLPSLPVTLLSLILFGIGLSAIFISIYNLAFEEAKIHGFHNMTHTSALIASLILTAFSIGVCVGAWVAGILFDYFGFRIATLFVVILNIIITIATAFYIKFQEKLRSMNSIKETFKSSKEISIISRL